MEESIRLGRIAGIRVGMNWSLLVVFWIITWGLADLLAARSPGYNEAFYWGTGLATAIAFFASLLAHEMGHALMARREGVTVEGITLWLFGGVSRLRGEAHTPSAELRIAVVGPLVSLGLALVFTLIAVVLASIGVTELVTAATAWLAGINALLGVFNMAPALPLDGGRVLRAFLWRRRGDRLSATLSAARAGKVFAYVLIGLGFVELTATAQALGGLWLIFLGWFVLAAARMEETQALLRDSLEGVSVGDVMDGHPVTGPASLSVQSFIADLALRHDTDTFVLTDERGEIVGLVTLAMLRRVPGELRSTRSVGRIARPIDQVATATPQEPIIDLLERMGEPGARALVFDDGRLVGIVTPAEIARSLERASLRARTPTPLVGRPRKAA